MAGARTFYKAAPFPGRTALPPRARSYKDCATLAFRYVFKGSITQYWLEHGVPDPEYYHIKAPKPSLLSDAIDVLLVNKVFTPQELVEELGNMGLAMDPSELELLLNLDQGTLAHRITPKEKIVVLKPFRTKDENLR